MTGGTALDHLASVFCFRQNFSEAIVAVPDCSAYNDCLDDSGRLNQAWARVVDDRSFYNCAAGDANPCLGSLSSDDQLDCRRSKDEAAFRQHFRFSPQAGGFSTTVDNLEYKRLKEYFRIFLPLMK